MSAATDDALVQTARHDRNGVDVAVLTLNRPAQQNPVDARTLEALAAQLDELAGPGGPAAIVLTGRGAAFSAGGDLKGYQDLYRRPDVFRRFLETFEHVCHVLERSSALTVAMVNGTCVAGGLELALACDLITISETARIGDGHLKFGQLPGAGGSQRLVRAIGVQQARRWLLTGRLFDARTAFDLGLAALVAPPADLEAATMDLIAECAGHSPLARATMKRLIAIAQNTPLDEGVRRELDIVVDYATTSHDATEGLRAFAERRRPDYRGC